MGTMLHLVVYANDEKRAQHAIDAGLDEIERLIPILNNYDPSSEVSRLSHAASGPSSLSSDLAGTLAAAKRWHDLSIGQFDITVGPLTRLWSRARKEKRLPDPSEIVEAQKRIGWKNLRLFQTEPTTTDRDQLSNPVQANFHEYPLRMELLAQGMIIDISGLATGYIIDRAFEAIVRSGHDCIRRLKAGRLRLLVSARTRHPCANVCCTRVPSPPPVTSTNLLKSMGTDTATSSIQLPAIPSNADRALP